MGGKGQFLSNIAKYRYIFGLVFLGPLLFLGFQNFSNAASASKVLIIYNSNYTIDSDGDGVQDSLEVANYYAATRGIPSTQILGIAATVSEANQYTSYPQFNTDFLVPIYNKLNSLGQTNIDAIVLCYGLPYKLESSGGPISIDNILMNVVYNESLGVPVQVNNVYWDSYPLFNKKVFGHFDHSLYYYVDPLLKQYPIYLVTRLDGPLGVGGVLDLIDRGLYAEKYLVGKSGYFTGNAYIDDENRFESATYTDAYLGSSYEVQTGDWLDYNGVDVNIAYGEHYVLNNSPYAALTLKWQSTGSIIGTAGILYTDGTSAVTAPNVLLYAGWYAYNNYIPTAWQWLPGAVGSDLDSSSMAYPIQSPYNLAWSNQALAHGITATCGSISEPGTDGAPENSVLLYYMLQGYSFAEAATLSDSNMGGARNVCIGDPLFTPYGSKTAVVDTTVPVFSPQPTLVQTQEYGAVVSGIISTSTAHPMVAAFTLGYGTSKATTFSGWSNKIADPSGYARRFSITAANLKPNTTYYYQVQAQGPMPKFETALSTIASFKTPAETAYLTQNVPGTILIYNFDNGEEGVSWHAPQPWQASGQKERAGTGIAILSSGYLTSTYAEEWLNYTVNVTTAGKYEIDLDACDCFYGSDGSSFHISLDGVNVSGTVVMPNLNKTFAEIVMATNVNFTAGTHVLQLFLEAGSGTDVNMKAFSEIGEFQSIYIH